MAPRPGTVRPWLPLAVLLLAGGCGMYGDLYLEEPEAPARPEVEELPPIVDDGDAAAERPAPEDEDKPKPQQRPPDGGQPTGHP